LVARVARRLGALVVAMAAACGARSDICVDAPCPDGDEVDPARACDRALTEPPPCTGSGLVATLPDECIDDGGDNATGDTLEVYCAGGIARFCLSYEDCPWRAGISTSDVLTCSTSGLGSSYMANTINGCRGWEGFDVYCCSSDGRMGVGRD
jgi:hypothetical protein